MRKLVKLKARELKPNPFQVRKPRTPAELRTLGESVIKGQKVPLIWTPNRVVRDGDGRLAGVMLIDPDFELEGIETDEDLDPSEIQLITATQKNLEPYERYKAMTQWMENHPGETAATLADRVGLDPSTVSRILSLARCIPAVQELAAAGALGVTEWHVFAKESDPRCQHELLAMRLEGKVSSRDGLESQRRKKRRSDPPSVKVSKIRIALACGVTVTFAGKDLSLDDAIEAASESHKTMKKGQEQGLTAKTIQKVSADRAKAG